MRVLIEYWDGKCETADECYPMVVQGDEEGQLLLSFVDKEMVDQYDPIDMKLVKRIVWVAVVSPDL
jgi:hypothetical protein